LAELALELEEELEEVKTTLTHRQLEEVANVYDSFASIAKVAVPEAFKEISKLVPIAGTAVSVDDVTRTLLEKYQDLKSYG
jgi:hypothetical protein